MKTPASQLLRILSLLFLIQQALAETIYNPIGPASGAIVLLDQRQFLGARFTISSPATLASVGGMFQDLTTSSGSFFSALVPLSSMTALPTGNPGAGVPFNPGEVLAYRTFDATIGTTPKIVTVPFSLDLSPGVYGVIFGTGLFGTAGVAGMPGYGTVAGSSGFFWSDQPWRWHDEQVNEYNIMITIVPEPSCTVLMALGLSGLALARRFRRFRS